MDRWIGIGIFCGGLAWLGLAGAIMKLPSVWDYTPLGSAPIHWDPRLWPVFAAISVPFLLSGLGIIRRARIHGAIDGSR